VGAALEWLPGHRPRGYGGMKVLLIEPWNHGGTVHYAAQLAGGLAAAVPASESAVHLAVARGFPYAPPGVTIHKGLTELRGARRGGRAASFLALGWRRRRQALEAVQLAELVKPDVIHVLGTSAVSGSLVHFARARALPLIVTVHDLPTGEGIAQRAFAFRSRHFTSADRILVHGDWSLKRLVERYGPSVGAKARPIRFGAYDYGSPTASTSELRARFRLPSHGPVVLFFGSLRRNKGLEVLLRALRRAPSVHLFVAGVPASGSEPGVEWYQRLARHIGVDARITWLTRYVGDDEVADVFGSADVVALPYLRSFAAQSSVLSIAATFGVPVIASDVGEMGREIRERSLGIYVQAESIEALGDALAHPPTRAERAPPVVGAAADEWKRVAEDHLAVYRALCAVKDVTYGSDAQSLAAR
jgi:glycosyltransferase involved in cell wall biosynthesis